MGAGMKIRMKFFAATKEAAGVSDALLDVPTGCTSTELLSILEKTYPQLQSLSEQLPTILAVNHSFLPLGDVCVLQHNDEVALIPPISGG